MQSSQTVTEFHPFVATLQGHNEFKNLSKINAVYVDCNAEVQFQNPPLVVDQHQYYLIDPATSSSVT